MKHAMVKLLCSQKLHFAPIGEYPQEVLDIGTGTGIWAIESAFPASPGVGSKTVADTDATSQWVTSFRAPTSSVSTSLPFSPTGCRPTSGFWWMMPSLPGSTPTTTSTTSTPAIRSWPSGTGRGSSIGRTSESRDPPLVSNC